MHKVFISRFFTIPVHELYGYFMDPVLLERWAYPEGMSLKVTMFDAREGGKYRWEHFSEGKPYIANGHFRLIELNKKLQMVDDEIIDPSGNVMETKLDCDIIFTSLGTGSGVEIRQSGFKNADGAINCEEGWNQCLDHLQELVKDSGMRQFRSEEQLSEKRKL